jgi:hypothetical protein
VQTCVMVLIGAGRYRSAANLLLEAYPQAPVEDRMGLRELLDMTLDSIPSPPFDTARWICTHWNLQQPTDQVLRPSE